MDDQQNNTSPVDLEQNPIPNNNPQQSEQSQPVAYSVPPVKQPRKKMSVKKKILIGAGIFVGVLVAVVLVLFLTTGKERSLASQFVADISSNKVSNAYSQFSSELKQVQDQSTFESQITTLDLNSSCALQISGLENSSSTDFGTIKIITGTIKCDSKELSTASFKYNGESKLVGYSIEP